MENIRQTQSDYRVLYISGVRGDTRRYRTIHPFEQLKLIRIRVDNTFLANPLLLNQIAQSDLVIFHRTPLDRFVRRLVDQIIAQDGLILVDVDDLVFEPSAFQWINSPDFQDPIRVRLYQDEMQRYRQMLVYSQAVIASTEFLADRVQKTGKPAFVHRNAFSLEMLQQAECVWKVTPSSSERVVLGYASGTPTHDKDFEVVKPAILKIMKHYPNVELHLLGSLNPGTGWEELETRIHRFPLVPWRELPGLLTNFDINLAPLVTNNPFSQSKSEIKWMEAGLVRVPTVASPTQAFMQAIQPGVNGMLAENVDEWEETLEQLIQVPELRNSIGQKVYMDVIEQYHPFVRARQLVNTFNKIGCLVGNGNLFEDPLEIKDAFQLPDADLNVDYSAWEIHPTLREMAFYSLRHRGIKILLQQVWVFIRRWLSPLIPYRKTPRRESLSA